MQRESAESPRIRKERESKVCFGFLFLPFEKRVSRSKNKRSLDFYFGIVAARVFISFGLCPLFVSLSFEVVHPMCWLLALINPLMKRML